MTAKKTATKKDPATKRVSKPAPYQQRKPLLTLLATRAGLKTFGYAIVEVLAFNVDGAGRALCRVYRVNGGAKLTLLSNELGFMLEHELDAVAYIEAPQGWTDGRPDLLDEFTADYCCDFDETWGLTFAACDSDASLARAGGDERKAKLAHRRGTDLFDRCLAKLKMAPREYGSPAVAYGDYPSYSRQQERVADAWDAAHRGRKKRCMRLLSKVAQKDRTLLA